MGNVPAAGFHMYLKFKGIPKIPKIPTMKSLRQVCLDKGIHMTEERKMKPPAGLNRLKAVQEAYEERAAILEYDAGMSREEAEKEARKLTGYEGW
ncbi:hypothetical protein [Sutterella wadsworthensis]|uniref:hypothetical protein n=1 Tax=Sutterella wadsworthensis TaxID=40545 RepID=UPI001C01048E|nr:hypothetical protein [Sutterella wadsworthensis]MBT9621502.1 hypothetical protein [Sutterella wadsworthensis]